MEVTLGSQLQGFLFACVAGFALGAFFDLFRIFRVLSGCDRTAVFFQDIFCLAFAGFVSFLVMLTVNAGSVRFFLLAGEGIGVCVWFLTIGEVTVRIARILYRIARAMFQFARDRIAYPLYRAAAFCLKGAWRMLKKGARTLKKFFAKRKNPLNQIGE